MLKYHSSNFTILLQNKDYIFSINVSQYIHDFRILVNICMI